MSCNICKCNSQDNSNHSVGYRLKNWKYSEFTNQVLFGNVQIKQEDMMTLVLVIRLLQFLLLKIKHVALAQNL